MNLSELEGYNGATNIKVTFREYPVYINQTKRWWEKDLIEFVHKPHRCGKESCGCAMTEDGDPLTYSHQSIKIHISFDHPDHVCECGNDDCGPVERFHFRTQEENQEDHDLGQMIKESVDSWIEHYKTLNERKK